MTIESRPIASLWSWRSKGKAWVKKKNLQLRPKFTREISSADACPGSHLLSPSESLVRTRSAKAMCIDLD